MKTKISFIKHFFKNRKEVGALIPSSKSLAYEMVRKNDVENANIIVEIGAGTGSFTKELSKYNLNNKQVIIIEKNIEFYNILKKDFPGLIIINDDILNLDKIMKKYKIKNIDLLISGIPFKSLDNEIYHKFIAILKQYFSERSKFIQFSYFKNTKNKLDLYFKNVGYKKVWLNIPFAYVFICSNIKK